MTIVFNNNITHLCYAYALPGVWERTGEAGLMRSAGGSAQVGVLLLSRQDLAGFEGPDLIARALNRAARDYEKKLGRRPEHVEVIPFESSRSGAVKWTASWRDQRGGQPGGLRADKVLWEVSPGWVVQISVAGAADIVTRRALETLHVTTQPECYLPLIRRNFAAPVAAGALEGLAAERRGDYATALRFWRPLADQGDALAQVHLGFMYDFGHGVPLDNATAVTWYRRAADQGYASGQYRLGLMYRDGRGVPQDYVQAYMWLDLAAGRFPASETELRAQAVGNRDNVALGMTPAQIAEAQRLAREWKPR